MTRPRPARRPLEFMRDRGAYALPGDMYLPYEREVDAAALEGCEIDDSGVFRRPGTPGTWSGASPRSWPA